MQNLMKTTESVLEYLADPEEMEEEDWEEVRTGLDSLRKRGESCRTHAMKLGRLFQDAAQNQCHKACERLVVFFTVFLDLALKDPALLGDRNMHYVGDLRRWMEKFSKATYRAELLFVTVCKTHG